MAAFLAPLIAGLASTALSAGLSKAGGGGSKPNLPQPITVDPKVAQRTAIGGNQQALTSLRKLSSDVNAIQGDELDRLLAKTIPGYKTMLSQGSDNIMSMMRGELPKDVQDQISRYRAESGVGRGVGRTEANSNWAARDLGLTSLDLSRQGTASAAPWLSNVKGLTTPQQFDITSMFMTPSESGAMMAGNAGAQNQRNMLQAYYNAMPDPTLAGLSNMAGKMGGYFMNSAANAWGQPSGGSVGGWNPGSGAITPFDLSGGL